MHGDRFEWYRWLHNCSSISRELYRNGHLFGRLQLLHELEYDLFYHFAKPLSHYGIL